MDTRPADDLWRIVAAIAVIAIHAAGGFEAGWPTDPQTWLAVPASQWARFSVPLFMVLSGFGLAHSERRRGLDRFDRAAWRDFWRRRGPRIALPYLVFTIAGLGWHGRLDGAALADGLLRGTGDYHLYFLAFLLQGYLIWPLVRRSSWRVVLGLLAVQALFASPMHVLWPGRPHVPAWLVVHWAGYLALGARIAHGGVTGRDRPPRGALAAALVGLALVIGEYTFWALRLDSPGHYNHFARWAVIAYALATVWLWRRSGPALTAGLRPRADRMAQLAGLTFTVYLIHPWVLRGLVRVPGEWPFAPRWLAAAALSFTLAAALDRWLWPTALRRPLGLG